MNSMLPEFFKSKLSAKNKSKAIAEALLVDSLHPSTLAEAIPTLLDVELAIVVESLEGATRKHPELINSVLFTLLVQCLAHQAPRVKWEAARTIGNVAKHHSAHLETAVEGLLLNTTDDGVVVRWATAQALTAILRSGYTDNELRAQLIEIASKEHDDGVRAVYEKGLKTRC